MLPFEFGIAEAKLLKWQKGRCLWYNLFFKPGDLLEIDHVIPKAKGGKDIMTNRQLLHRHCHDQKTATDNNLIASGIYDKDQIAEEPCEPFGSRTVL